MVAQKVLRHEDHAERSVIERGDGLEAAVEEDTADKIVPHAVHGVARKETKVVQMNRERKR